MPDVLVMATMMMLFLKGSKAHPTPWVLSGIVALILFEIGAADTLVLLGSVFAGMMVAIAQVHRSRG